MAFGMVESARALFHAFHDDARSRHLGLFQAVEGGPFAVESYRCRYRFDFLMVPNFPSAFSHASLYGPRCRALGGLGGRKRPARTVEILSGGREGREESAGNFVGGLHFGNPRRSMRPAILNPGRYPLTFGHPTLAKSKWVLTH